MSRLSGVVDLDTKGALANLRKLRGELQATTKSNTTVKVGFDTKAAKSELGKLKTDIAGLKKLGAQSKVDLAIKADTKGALDGLGKVSKALKDIGKNKRVTITVDVSDAKRRTRELSEVDKRAAEDKKRAIREADRERERADKAAIAGAKAVASAQKRAINEAKVAAGQLADKFSASATRGGLAILGGLGLAAKKAIDFEDAFAGVTKTVKANDAQLASLSGRLRSMSKEIPVAATELSHIAQTAGQLGIHVPNIAKFTRVIADLGVSTNLTAEQGALELAKFANITKMSERDFDRLGSSIVDLGNHFATTEKDVSSMSLRIATVGAQVGLSQTQILGYATAISSLGIKTEAGGSSIGAVFAKLEDATQKGGGALKVFSHIAGQSTSAFKRQFDKDASGATLRFIKGLAQMKKEGGNVIGTLTDLGLGERRTRSTILALAGNTELLERALKQSSTAWKENTALARESGIRYKTTASQLKIATNNLTDFGISVGASVVPPLVSLLHKADPLLDKFRALDKTAQENTVKWVALGGAGLLVAGRLKGLVDTALLARTVMLGLAAARARDTASLTANTGALGTNTAALGANSAAAGANAGAVGAAGAAATEAGAGAASGAVGIGAFGVAFGIASAAAIVATTAIGLYKINAEVAAKKNTELTASNKGLEFSTKGVSTSFDALTKSAKGNGEAATSVSKLRTEYEKLSKTDLKKFSVASLPKARANISLNSKLSNSDKDALLYQLDGLQARVQDQLAAKRLTIKVKAEADKGALDNLKGAFYNTYGNLYDGWKTVFLHPTVDSAKWAFGQIGYVAKTSFDGVAKGMVDLRKGLSDAWYSLTGGFESGFNRMLRGLSDSITTFNGNLIKSVSSNAAYYWKMYNGQTANYGETDGPSMGGYGPGWLAEQKKKNAAWKAAQAKLKNSADFKRGAGGMLASADKYGDAADQIPKPKTKTGWGVGTPPDLGGQSESDKVKERAAREQLRREKDAINDVAKAYEYKAQAAKKAAQITIEGAKNELEKLKDVRDSLKDKFGDLQSEFVSLGIINDPLGPMIKRFEQLIDVAGKSGKIVADARKSYNASFGAAKSASSMATGARSKSELLSGLDGVVPTKGGSLSNGSLPPFLKAMADKTGGTIGLQCGATITEFLHRAGIKGTATSIARSGNAKANADGTYAPGTIFNFKGGKGGYRVNHYATVAPDGQHWLESNWAGKGQRPNMITDKRLINWKRDIDAATWGGRRNIGQPSGVLAGKGGGFYRGTSNGASGGGSGDFPDFDLKVINGSLRKIGAIDSAWGKGVKSGEGTAARFSFQTALASKEYQDQLKAMAAQAGITFPQLVKMFRDFANKADIDLNRVKAVDAVTDSLKELDKTRRAIGSEKNPFASILGEFEAGGKYAGAPEKKLALLDSQRKLSVDQTTQATKEATRAEREKISVLSLAGRALNAYTIKTGQYEIALEKEQARFDVWKRPEVTNLLEEAKTYDKLGGSILKVGKALAANPFVSAPGASARMLTQGMGLKGRAAGLFANANKTAGTILDAQDKSSEYARAWGRTKADLEANDALDAQIIALKEEGSILKNLALSETERTDKIERSNFLLEKRSALLKLDHTSKDAERLAEGYAVKNDEIKRLTRRNEETKAYTSLLEESARAVKLAQGQTAITLKYPGYSPDTERKLALFEKTQALLGEFKDSGKKTFNDFDFFGKLKTFEKTFDAQAGLKNAGAVRSILDEAKQSALMFGDSSITAGIKFRTAFGDLSGEPDKVKRSLISATAQVQMFADANAALDAARTQSLDLSKQLEAQRMGRFRPLTSRQSQELDWKYSDLDAQMKNPGAIMDKKAQSVIQLQRDNVRGLLDSLTREAKIDTLTGKISDSFDNMFDSIIAKEKSAGAILRDGFQSTLTGLAGDFLKSQFRSLLGNLFTGVLGGGKTSGLLGNITPFAGGSISAGLASSGRGLFGGSGSGYGLKLDGSHAKGLDYVPKSPYYAELHRGETVLNSNEAARYRESRQAELIAGASSRSSGGGGNITVNYVHNGNVVANSPQEYQKKLQDQARRRGGSQRSLSQQREITQRFLGLK